MADVLELIKALNLGKEFAERINPHVREKYIDLWKSARRRFVTLWRNKWLTAKATTLGEMVAALRATANELEAMRCDGVTLDSGGGTEDDYAQLTTSDPKIAEKYGMVDEVEFWGSEDDDDNPPPGDDAVSPISSLPKERFRPPL